MEHNKKDISQETCECCRHKHTPRSNESQRQLVNRLNRMIGQLNGIKNMVEDNRYCGDILIQIAAVESALQSFGHIVLRDHMETCVVEQIQEGNLQVIGETIDLVKKLK